MQGADTMSKHVTWPHTILIPQFRFKYFCDAKEDQWVYGLVAILFRKRTELQLDNALKPAPSPMPSCGALFVVQQNLW